MNDFLALYQIIIIDDEPWALNYMKKIFELQGSWLSYLCCCFKRRSCLKADSKCPSSCGHYRYPDVQNHRT